MTMAQFVEAKPLIALAATIAAIGVVLGAIFTIDSRYAHAGDLKQLTVQMEIQSLDQRSASLRDKVFDLEQKKRTPADQASLSRYQNEQRDVDRQLSKKRELLDQMKAGR